MATTKQITERFSITQYFPGVGNHNRTMLQITDNSTVVYSDNAYIQGISTDDAKAIGEALIDWSRNGLE